MSASPMPMSLAVVGAAHLNADKSNRQFEILLCAPGEPIELRPEPKNEHDPHAIAVFSCRGVQIGYLSAERAPRIGAMMREHEVQAVFQRKAEFGAWIRVGFGEAPVVTDAMLVNYDGEAEELDHDPYFYPDEGPDDENPEWTDDDLARARPIDEFPDFAAAWLRRRSTND